MFVVKNMIKTNST